MPVGGSVTYKRVPGEGIPVLCFFDCIGRDGGRTVRFTDSVMIEVEFSDEIIWEFERVMRRRAAAWTSAHAATPKPLEWTLLKYMTPDGREKF